jgi:inhibitor of KinA
MIKHKFNLTYRRFNSKSILISWPNLIENDVLLDVLSFKKSINLSNKPLLEVINAYNSLLIVYKITIDNIYDEIEALKSLYLQKNNHVFESRIIWKIPVCYNDYYGIDLDNISKKINIKKDKIIQLHYENTYKVCFLGFLPGFLYLSNLNKKLYFPRKVQPDLNIIKGSVGIGGNQTGVYPFNSPGGWNIIGNSPIDFVDKRNLDKISFASPGDSIKFYPIDIEEHNHISNNLNTYTVESEVSND